MRNQFRKSIKCELRYSVFPKSILEAKYSNEVSEFSLQRNMNGYAEMVGYGIRIKTPYFRHFFLTKTKEPCIQWFYPEKTRFLMCIKIYETILPSQYKITALPVNFRNNIITHYELRITH